MSIGTISLNINTDDLNYGAMLHSWAFQRYLQSKGIESEIIDYISPKFANKDLKHPYSYLWKEGYTRSAIIAYIRKRAFEKRFDKFEHFKKKHLVISNQKYDKEKLNSAKLSQYDTLVCESDVIWDPSFFDGEFDDTFFLALESMKNKKRIAYSASMGNLKFDTDQAKRFEELVSCLDYVSCRETYATEYINHQTKKFASCVLDPVMLLREKDYEPIISCRVINEPYVLLYTPVGYNVNLINTAKQVAKDTGLKLVEVSLFPWNGISHKTIVDAGVEEFLSLIKHANLILTNSFHGVCFSLIFRKQFYAFSRETGRKIEDVCRRFNLQRRFLTKDFCRTEDINYGQVADQIEQEIKKSEEFIRESLAI